MKLDNKAGIKRLVIYFFYDEDGVVDDYVTCMLEEMKKHSTEIFVVCNGKLTPAGRKKFYSVTPNVLVRDNKGFDVWAYKTALEHYGWEKLSGYDEVIMMNHTIMGPVYPFSEMFEAMDKRDVDFWGITKFHQFKDGDPFGTICYGYIPEHIQSHFIAVRNPMLSSTEFHDYWENRPEINNYADAVGKHEAIFTKKFHDLGFDWDVYVDTSYLEGFTLCPLIMCPTRIISEIRCPIFKRRSFFHDYGDILHNTAGGQGKELLSYLQNHTDYDCNLIWENILRSVNMSDIKKCLDLNYIIPDDHLVPADKAENTAAHKKLGLVMHIYFKDLIDYCYDYALSMPETAEVIITTDSEAKKQAIEEKFEDGPWAKVTVLLIKNRGRDVSALLVAAAPYLDQFDYVCFMHDKKVQQLDLGIKGYCFSERCFKNLLGSKELVSNIVDRFEKEPKLGLLCPPTPNEMEYYSTLGSEWGPNYECTKKLYEKLDFTVPMSYDKEPIAPLGTMFWFRPEALKKLTDRGWEYSDFPREPNQTDGTLLHAIERIYPFAVQQAGYYVAWVLSEQYARTEWTNLNYMLRELNVRLFNIYGPRDGYTLTSLLDYHISQRNIQKQNPAAAPAAGNDMMLQVPDARLIVKREIKDKIPKPIWWCMKKIYHLFGGKKWVG